MAGGSGMNAYFIRYAGVLLMAAETDAHLGNLMQAMKYVNQVRARIKNHPNTWNSYKDNEAYAKAVVNSQSAMLNTDASIGDWVVRTDTKSTWSLLKEPATDINNWNEYKDANYNIDLYTPADFNTKHKALDHIYLEFKLELAMEGQRFFNLVRWGIASNAINHYYKYQGAITPDVRGAHFAPKNRYFPIPQRQIDLSTKNGHSVLKQNPGYK
jgi:hypothetical protein